MAAAGTALKSKAIETTARRSRRAVLVALGASAVAVLLVLLLLTAVIAALLGGSLSAPGGPGSTPPATGARPASAEALLDIPADYLRHYAQAAAVHGIDWAVLAGVGKVECDHGRSTLDGCNQAGTLNEAGARGPMQFLGSTWRAGADTFDPDVAGEPVPHGHEHLGYATDGNGNGIADPWDPADAVHSAARMLTHHGAPADYQTALLAYNPSSTYVENVLRHADNYRADTAEDQAFTGTPGEVPLIDVTCPGGGTTTIHTQLMPVVEALYAQADHSLCGGGYRDPQRQVELRQAHCGTSDYAIYQMPSSQCSPPTATPGNSMHELGLAIDLTCDGTLINTRASPCFTWLNEHAEHYALHNLPSEPWHWSTNGN